MFTCDCQNFRLLIQIVVCLCGQKDYCEMHSLFHPALIIEYFLVYVKPQVHQWELTCMETL